MNISRFYFILISFFIVFYLLNNISLARENQKKLQFSTCEDLCQYFYQKQKELKVLTNLKEKNMFFLEKYKNILSKKIKISSNISILTNKIEAKKDFFNNLQSRITKRCVSCYMKEN